jgi:hypothetical protein
LINKINAQNTFSQKGIFNNLILFDNKKISYIIRVMVVITTAGGSGEQRTREGNDGRVD